MILRLLSYPFTALLFPKWTFIKFGHNAQKNRVFICTLVLALAVTLFSGFLGFQVFSKPIEYLVYMLGLLTGQFVLAYIILLSANEFKFLSSFYSHSLALVTFSSLPMVIGRLIDYYTNWNSMAIQLLAFSWTILIITLGLRFLFRISKIKTILQTILIIIILIFIIKAPFLGLTI